MDPSRRRALVVASLAILYVVWGSTYLAQRWALEAFTPFQMAGLRFSIAGALLYAFARSRGAPVPDRVELRGAALSALPLLVLGMGTAAYALRRVPSGLGALVFGAVPLLATLFDTFWGGRFRKTEAAGLAVGLAGVLLASLRGGLAADPVGAVLLLCAAVSYAVGAVLTRRLTLPKGLIATAVQTLVGGGVMLALSLVTGEPLPRASAPAWAALAYLLLFGTVVAYSAFGFLLRTVRPALATSYAFVNPVVAIGLGAVLAGERLTPADLVALALVLAAVGLVSRPGGETPPARVASPAVGKPTLIPLRPRARS